MIMVALITARKYGRILKVVIVVEVKDGNHLKYEICHLPSVPFALILDLVYIFGLLCFVESFEFINSTPFCDMRVFRNTSIRSISHSDCGKGRNDNCDKTTI